MFGVLWGVCPVLSAIFTVIIFLLWLFWLYHGALWDPTRDWTWASAVKTPWTNHLRTKEFPASFFIDHFIHYVISFLSLVTVFVVVWFSLMCSIVAAFQLSFCFHLCWISFSSSHFQSFCIFHPEVNFGESIFMGLIFSSIQVFFVFNYLVYLHWKQLLINLYLL